MSGQQNILGSDEIVFNLQSSSGLTINPQTLDKDNLSTTFTLGTNLQELQTLGKGTSNQLLTTNLAGTAYQFQNITTVLPLNLQQINTLGKGTTNQVLTTNSSGLYAWQTVEQLAEVQVGGFIRSGSVVVGNIGLTGTVGLSVSGAITGGLKQNGYTERDAIVNISYSNRGYVPQVFVSCIHNPITSSTTNDLFQHTIQNITSTGTQIYLEKNNAGDTMGIILYIMIMKPDLV